MIESEIYREENNNMKRAILAKLYRKGHNWQSNLKRLLQIRSPFGLRRGSLFSRTLLDVTISEK